MIKLHLAKQNFKFSAAHFLIFDSRRAERLHGHNYTVKVELSGEVNPETGFLVDFSALKKIIKRETDRLDELVLLPKLNKEFTFTKKGSSLEVKFRDRFYVFPKNEVLLLPVFNTSVELLAEYFFNQIKSDLKSGKILKAEVSITETAGQSAIYIAKL